MVGSTAPPADAPPTMTLPDAALVATTERVYLAQVFGPTIQGEGPSRGTLAHFIRFSGCNLKCTWCDTPYTWDPAAGMREWRKAVAVADVVRYLRRTPAPLWVITGGEPLLHQRAEGLSRLLTAAADDGATVEVETNGTIAPDPAVWGRAWTTFNVSPKLAHAGDPQDRRIRPAALAAFSDLARAGLASFKFVARNPDDLDEVAELVRCHRIPDRAVWVMPEGTTADAVLTHARALADPVMTRGWNLTLRDHVLLWGQDVRR